VDRRSPRATSDADNEHDMLTVIDVKKTRWRAISTRYAMLATQPGKDLRRGLRAPAFHVGQPPLHTLNCFDAVEERLVPFGVLRDGRDRATIVDQLLHG
jgi:hypothetical protein